MGGIMSAKRGQLITHVWKFSHDVFWRDSPKRSALRCPCLLKNLHRGEKQTEKNNHGGLMASVWKNIKKEFCFKYECKCKTQNPKKTPHRGFHYKYPLFMVFCFMELHRCCIFYKLNICGNPALCKSIGSMFQEHCSLHVSVSCFGNSHSISSFFIRLMFVMLISEICCYCCKKIVIHWRLRC